jgi:hypothetical protein
MKELLVARLSTATVYRVFFFGLLFGCIPIFVVLGVLAYFGLSTLTWNHQPLTGLKAIFVSPVMGVFFALLGTAFFGSAAALGLWIRSKFRPLAIQYQDSSADA